MATASRGLLRYARLTRRQLIAFALVSAAINGIITASVGAWLGQTYTKYQARRQSIENLVHLVYERRTRAGMVASSLRRGADLDEIRFRKRAYDEAYVDWNKNVMQNVFAIREVTGEHLISGLETYYENGLVESMADVDRCLTKAYDARLANSDPKVELEKCHMAALHQFVLDCGATFTNELYKLTKLSFIPFSTTQESRATSEKRIAKACTRQAETAQPPAPPASPEPSDAVAPSAAAPPAPQPAPALQGPSSEPTH